MSVPTDKRKPSIVQYVTTAQDLHRFTIQRLAKLPGKYKSYICDPLAKLAGNVMESTLKTNELDKLDDVEYQERKNYANLDNRGRSFMLLACIRFEL